MELASPTEDGTARPLWVPPGIVSVRGDSSWAASSPSLGGRASDHPTLEEPAPDGLGVRTKPVADAGKGHASLVKGLGLVDLLSIEPGERSGTRATVRILVTVLRLMPNCAAS